MATTSILGIDEYLRSTYEPDAEFVDGKLEERNVGKWEHSRMQALMAAIFHQHELPWGVRCVTEQRMRVSATRIRIPDVALLPPGRQPEIITEAPILIVEIMSPEDRYPRTVSRLREFLDWGVPTAWLIDPTRSPDTLAGEVWTADGGKPANVLTVAGTSIQLDLAELHRMLQQS